MKLLDLITDPNASQLSTSRLGLLLMNVVGAGVAVYLAIKGEGQWAAGILTGIAATDAGVYFASTRKNYREGNSHDG